MNVRRRDRAERRVRRRTDFTFSLPFLYQISWCCGRGRPHSGKTLPFLYLFHTKIEFEWFSVRAHTFQSCTCSCCSPAGMSLRGTLNCNGPVACSILRRRLRTADMSCGVLRAQRSRFDAVGGGREPLFTQRFQFNGVRVLNLELVLAAPVNERGSGDAEFGHQAGVSPALGAKLDETLDNLWCMHT